MADKIKFVIGYLLAYRAAEILHEERLRTIESRFVSSMAIINSSMQNARPEAKVATTRKAESARYMTTADAQAQHSRNQSEIKYLVGARFGDFGEILMQKFFDSEDEAKAAIAAAKLDDAIKSALAIEPYRVTT